MKTAEFWKGEFGDSYTTRNRVDWSKRYDFWKAIMNWYCVKPRSVYEVGCNAGWNLTAIKQVASWACVYGEEINDSARAQAENAGLNVFEPLERINKNTKFELVFTSGVLIHIATQDLKAFMQRIIDLSSDYVLAVEYDAATEEEVIYRGHEGKLWKRPYGELYKALGMKLVYEDHAGIGFDNCKYWLFRK